MPKQFDEAVKEFAKELWEGGTKPDKVLDQLTTDRGVDVSDKTLRRWAKAGQWRDWKLARREIAEHFNPDLPFGVSHIHDPVLHLALVIARRAVREDSRTRSGRPQWVTKSALEEVQRQLEPGWPVLEYIRPIIMDYIRDWRKGPMINYPSPIDPESEAILVRLDLEGSAAAAEDREKAEIIEGAQS